MSINEEIIISAIVASSDFSDTIEEKKKLRNPAKKYLMTKFHNNISLILFTIFWQKGCLQNFIIIPTMIIRIIIMTARKAIPPKLRNKGLLVTSFAPIF